MYYCIPVLAVRSGVGELCGFDINARPVFMKPLSSEGRLLILHSHNDIIHFASNRHCHKIVFIRRLTMWLFYLLLVIVVLAAGIYFWRNIRLEINTPRNFIDKTKEFIPKL
jgi:hypothetical protein